MYTDKHEVVKALQEGSYNFKVIKKIDGLVYTKLLFITQKSKSKYFLGYIKYYIKDGNLFYKDLYLRVDRVFFLEVANITIEDSDRFNLLESIVGKRQFTMSDKDINCYLIDYSIDINWIKELSKDDKEELKKDKKRYFYHKGYGKNINFYEIYFLEKDGFYYTLLIQNNVASSNLEVKEFIVELSSEDFEEIIKLNSKDEKVNSIFEKIGKNYINSFEFKELKDVNEDEVKDVILKDIVDGEKEKDDLITISFQDSPLKSKESELNEKFSKLNKMSIQILKEPFDSEDINSLAYSLKGYTEVLKIEPNVSNLQNSLIKLYENIFLSKNLEDIFANQKFIEALVEIVEILEEWQDSIFNNKYDFMINFMLGELVEKIDYMNSYFK